jgi:hypothetical protein
MSMVARITLCVPMDRSGRRNRAGSPNRQGTPFMVIVVCAGFAAVIPVGSTHTGDLPARGSYRKSDFAGH